MKRIIYGLLSTAVASSAFAGLEKASDIPQGICGENPFCWMSSSLPISTMMPFTFTADMTTYASSDLKVVIAGAREDAAYFLSTDGEVRTARFENALQVIHAAFPQHEASDLEVAQWILTVQ